MKWHQLHHYPEPYELVLARDDKSNFALLRWSGKEWLQDLTTWLQDLTTLTHQPHITEWTYAFVNFKAEEGLPFVGMVLGLTQDQTMHLCHYKDGEWIEEETGENLDIALWSYIESE
jgi:hypothetical protein